MDSKKVSCCAVHLWTWRRFCSPSLELQSSAMEALEVHCYKNCGCYSVMLFMVFYVFGGPCIQNRFCQQLQLLFPLAGCHSAIGFPSQHLCSACMDNLDVSSQSLVYHRAIDEAYGGHPF